MFGGRFPPALETRAAVFHLGCLSLGPGSWCSLKGEGAPACSTPGSGDNRAPPKHGSLPHRGHRGQPGGVQWGGCIEGWGGRVDGDVIAEEFSLGGGEKGRERKSQAHQARGPGPVAPPQAHALPAGPFSQPQPPHQTPRELVSPSLPWFPGKSRCLGAAPALLSLAALPDVSSPPGQGCVLPSQGHRGGGTVLPPCQHHCRGFSHVPCNTHGTGGLLPLPALASPGGCRWFWACVTPPPARSDAGCRVWGHRGHLGSRGTASQLVWLHWGCPSSKWQEGGGDGRLGAVWGRQWVSTAGLRCFIPAGSRERSPECRSRATQTTSRCTAEGAGGRRAVTRVDRGHLPTPAVAAGGAQDEGAL